MAGIYIHIPYCKQACHYCNFHFSTTLGSKSAMVEAISKELSLRKQELQSEKIATIYFGGGTPSLLSSEELDLILSTIHKHYDLAEKIELTIEANPDDITPTYLKQLKAQGINRFSLGVQSFHEEDLKWMNRAHNAQESLDSIKRIQDAGFDNFSIDLIFGSPTTSNKNWDINLEKATVLKIPHLSCYGLTVEPNTVLNKKIQSGNSKSVDQELHANQFSMTIKKLEASGYDHYEISNYALAGMEARHNTNYWKNEKYLGVGPSAHSYDGKNRYWNIKSNAKYIEEINADRLPSYKEILTNDERYNEYILTGLRTKWGCSIERIAAFGDDFLIHFEKELQIHLNEKKLIRDGNVYRLSPKGKLFADLIASDLFKV